MLQQMGSLFTVRITHLVHRCPAFMARCRVGVPPSNMCFGLTQNCIHSSAF